MEKLYKIGDVSKLCDISVKTLRYYEELDLIKPSNVDAFTGYRYYDEENVKKIKQILLLKDLNFSLQEIKDFDYSSFYNKTKELEQQIRDLNKKLSIVSSYNVEKGEIVMKEFINDEKVIGKWKYETSALSKEHYKKGDSYVDDKVIYRELYFMPEGKGYWIFEGWSKGKIYHTRGVTYEYEIENDKMFLLTKYINTNEVAGCLVFNKVDSKEYKVEDFVVVDDVNYPFIIDERLLGKWEVWDFVDRDRVDTYVPQKEQKFYYLRTMEFFNNGTSDSTDKLGNHFGRNWTSGHILTDHTDGLYQIKTFDGEDYLFFEWKTGNYTFAGVPADYYVLKKVK